MKPAPNGGNQHPIWLLPLLTCCQPCLGLFIHGWSISAGAMFGEPLRPKIEIITTGREKRKSENVSECAYALSGDLPPPPPYRPPSLCQSLHPSLLHCLLSVLFSADRGSKQAGGLWRGDVGHCVWSGLGGSAPVNSGKAKWSSPLGSWYYLWSLCAFLWVLETQTPQIST